MQIILLLEMSNMYNFTIIIRNIVESDKIAHKNLQKFSNS